MYRPLTRFHVMFHRVGGWIFHWSWVRANGFGYGSALYRRGGDDYDSRYKPTSGFLRTKTLAHTQEAVVARRARNRALADFVASQGATFVPAAPGAAPGASGGTVRLPGGKSESLNQFFAGAGAGA